MTDATLVTTQERSSLLNRWWRVLATGFSFAAFGIGGLLLGAVVFPLLQKLPHLAQIGAHRRLQRGVALDQGPRDAEGDGLGAHFGLLDRGFAHGRLRVDIVWLMCWLLEQIGGDR